MATSTNVTHILSPDQKSGSKQQEQDRQQETKEQVQVDLSNMIGRIKPKPVCVDATLKEQSMSFEEISKFVFLTSGSSETGNKSSLSVVSSSSSTASPDNGLSDSTSDAIKPIQTDIDTKEAIDSTSFSDGGFLHRKSESERINLKVKTQTISRNGRQTQRWYTDPTTHTLYRMTTGCIPVLKNGKVLLCSASRKSEWILPKGGWEKDEAMEESAIRETFEEAGVFGIIGPTLSEIAFETRKGKKRRLEYEEVQRKAKQIREAQSSSPKAVPRTEEFTTPEKNEIDKSAHSANGLDQQQNKINQHSSDGDNISVASETSLSHAHVKMSLFPLYVTEVKETWPEQGRFRKVVDIDEAILMSESRPYFQKALKELKERNLHISQELQPIHENGVSSASKTTTVVTGKNEDI